MNLITKSNKLEHYKLMANLCMYIGPVFAILAIICGVGYNHYNNKVKDLKEELKTTPEIVQKGATVDFSIQQTTVVKIHANDQPYDGMLGLLIYDMTLVNSSNQPLTIKDAIIEFDLEDKHYSEIALNLFTGVCTTENSNVLKPAIRLKDGANNYVYLVDWYNIRDEISKGTLLKPGEILKGSAFYLLHINKGIEFSKVKNIRLIVSDYLGSQNSTSLNFGELQGMPVLDLFNEKFHYEGEKK